MYGIIGYYLTYSLLSLAFQYSDRGIKSKKRRESVRISLIIISCRVHSIRYVCTNVESVLGKVSSRLSPQIDT